MIIKDIIMIPKKQMKPLKTQYKNICMDDFHVLGIYN